MIFKYFNQNYTNEELPARILEQRILYRTPNKELLAQEEKAISSFTSIRTSRAGRYSIKSDVSGGGEAYDYHVFYSPNTSIQTSSDKRKLYVLFFAARSFEKVDGIKKFRALPFFPRWSYSNFLDGDVLCIEDPMYYMYPNLHVGWMYGNNKYSILDNLAQGLNEFISSRFRKQNVCLIGSSCGGYAALQIGAKLNGVNVVTVNPQIYIQNYKYYFNEFVKIVNVDRSLIDNDSRFQTDALILGSNSRFVIACNMLSKEDYDDQMLEFSSRVGAKLQYGVTEYQNVRLWLYQAEADNPHSTMEDHNLIFALLNLVAEDKVDNTLYEMLSEVWANNFELKKKNSKVVIDNQRAENSSKPKQRLPPKHFDVELRWNSDLNKDRLLIVCSHKQNFAFYKYPFKQNTLFISDKQDTYFTLYAGRLMDYIKEVIVDNGVKDVVFLGCSKGGFGAMLLASLCAKYCPNKNVRFISFSPQTIIYPFNSNLYFPSYKTLMTRAQTDENIRICLERYGNVTKLLGLSNLSGEIHYSEFNEPDNIEQHRVSSCNVRKYPYPFSFHGTISAFAVEDNSIDKIRTMVTSIYKNSQREVDLGASLPKEPEELVNQICRVKVSSLQKIVSDNFDLM
ncbi:MAG: hypothetical protein J7E09_20645 [Escherichia coli]|nr:hypothetical protein [Escherichia coli]